MKRRGCLLLRTKGERNRLKLLKKNPGRIEWVTGLFFIVYLMILLCAELQLSVYHASGLYLEDALAMSNLASAVIDIEEYGRTHVIRIADPEEAYGRYVNAVKENLQLNENWECANSALISGPVGIVRYVIYNVEKDEVKVFHISGDGKVSTEQGVLGRVVAPDGAAVEATSIYSEISFPVKGLLGGIVQARKGKLIDIVAEEGEENAESKNHT